MHATEWISEHGRFMRVISADKLRTALNRQNGECTWCGQPVSPGRIRYCSAECCSETKWRISPAIMCTRRERRKNLRCAECGLDLRWLKSLETRVQDAWLQCRDYAHEDWTRSENWGKRATNKRGRRNQRRVSRWAAMRSESWRVPGAIKQFLLRHGYRDGRGHLWEWDHVLPVIEGGGLCGEAGFRLLCVRCHKATTKRLAQRRGRQAKNQESQLCLFSH